MAIKALQDPLACSVDYHRFPKHQVGPPQHLVEKQTQESLRRSFLPQTRSLPEGFYGSAIFYGTIWMACHHPVEEWTSAKLTTFFGHLHEDAMLGRCAEAVVHTI
jgi:hypothetical protein